MADNTETLKYIMEVVNRTHKMEIGKTGHSHTSASANKAVDVKEIKSDQKTNNTGKQMNKFHNKHFPVKEDAPLLSKRSQTRQTTKFLNIANNRDRLMEPLLNGWTREIVRRTQLSQSKVRLDVYYRSPCGRKYRSNKEVERYLLEEETPYTLENFSFVQTPLGFAEPYEKDRNARLTRQTGITRFLPDKNPLMKVKQIQEVNFKEKKKCNRLEGNSICSNGKTGWNLESLALWEPPEELKSPEKHTGADHILEKEVVYKEELCDDTEVPPISSCDSTSTRESPPFARPFKKAKKNYQPKPPSLLPNDYSHKRKSLNAQQKGIRTKPKIPVIQLYLDDSQNDFKCDSDKDPSVEPNTSSAYSTSRLEPVKKINENNVKKIDVDSNKPKIRVRSLNELCSQVPSDKVSVPEKRPVNVIGLEDKTAPINTSQKDKVIDSLMDRLSQPSYYLHAGEDTHSNSVYFPHSLFKINSYNANLPKSVPSTNVSVNSIYANVPKIDFSTHVSPSSNNVTVPKIVPFTSVSQVPFSDSNYLPNYIRINIQIPQSTVNQVNCLPNDNQSTSLNINNPQTTYSTDGRMLPSHPLGTGRNLPDNPYLSTGLTSARHKAVDYGNLNDLNYAVKPSSRPSHFVKTIPENGPRKTVSIPCPPEIFQTTSNNRKFNLNCRIPTVETTCANHSLLRTWHQNSGPYAPSVILPVFSSEASFAGGVANISSISEKEWLDF